MIGGRYMTEKNRPIRCKCIENRENNLKVKSSWIFIDKFNCERVGTVFSSDSDIIYCFSYCPFCGKSLKDFNTYVPD